MMNDSSANPTAIVLAGINGAGKTTASRSLLANTLHVMTFVNADVIAQGLSGFDPSAAALRAGRIMLEHLDELAAQRANFAFETTMAGRTYMRWLNSLRETGYRVHLFYFWLNNVELAISRVATRVKNGGHHVPDATIRQRYERSIRNLFDLYIPVVNTWRFYDNSEERLPLLIAEGVRGADEIIYVPDTWSRIRRSANG
jgi:predicted ABC-type ATPase